MTATAGDSERPRVGGLRSPKLMPAARKAVTPGSKYYAGYDAGFVEDLLPRLELPANASVLDPWNGAGTTTTVVDGTGHKALGFDINPVLVVVGKAKLRLTGVEQSLEPMVLGIIERARDTCAPVPDEPLEQWFKPRTAAYFRALEEALHRSLVAPQEKRDLRTAEGLAGVSALAASFYVVLFETVRGFMDQYRTTNPTWIKKSSNKAERISLLKDDVDARFKECELRLHRHLEKLKVEVTDDAPAVESSVGLASSTNLPLDADSVEACVSSPPYCTRIDYPVLTRPELAVLGIGDDDQMRALREATIGTTTMPTKRPVARKQWGATAYEFVNSVGNHESKASKSYYQPYFLQYFDMMYSSMKELRRTLRDGAPCALVVQDSYYKEVRIDLAQALVDMGAGLGWSASERVDFDVPRTMAGMHPVTQKYRATSAATESLVILR